MEPNGSFFIKGGTVMWYLKQLLPLTYRSHYRQSGKKMFAVWRMWLGKCFDIEKVEVQ